MVDSIGQNQAHYMRQLHFDSERMAGSVAAWGKSSSNPVPSINQSVSINLSPSDTVSTNTTEPTFSFGELLDIINPLQHIPLVGSLYRNFTGDQMSPVARIVGGTIFGGPLGGITSIAAAAIEEHSGKNVTSALTQNAFVQDTEKPHYNNVEQRTAGGQSQVDNGVTSVASSPVAQVERSKFNS